MYWFIQDYNEYEIFMSNLWHEFYLPKFRMFMVVDEPYLTIYWTDSEKGKPGVTRSIRVNYNDVVDGYGGYLSNPSSAAQLKETLDAYIVSAWTDLQNEINNVDSLDDLVVTEYLSFANPNLDLAAKSKAAINMFNFRNFRY